MGATVRNHCIPIILAKIKKCGNSSGRWYIPVILPVGGWVREDLSKFRASLVCRVNFRHVVAI